MPWVHYKLNSFRCHSLPLPTPFWHRDNNAERRWWRRFQCGIVFCIAGNPIMCLCQWYQLQLAHPQCRPKGLVLVLNHCASHCLHTLWKTANGHTLHYGQKSMLLNLLSTQSPTPSRSLSLKLLGTYKESKQEFICTECREEMMRRPTLKTDELANVWFVLCARWNLIEILSSVVRVRRRLDNRNVHQHVDIFCWAAKGEENTTNNNLHS